MKQLDKKHKLAYQDVFLYTKITSRITNNYFGAEVSSPFEYKDGEKLDIFLDSDVIVGIGQRNFQRERLMNNRGMVIIIRGMSDKHPEKIIGKWDKVKKVVILYPTERLLPEELKLLGLLQNHLTENKVSVIIEIDEKRRYRNEMRRKRGDRIQSRDIYNPYSNHTTYDDDEDYDEDDD